MNLRKANSFISDPSRKKEFHYYVELSKKVKELLDIIESTPGRRSLFITTKRGDTYTYTWNSCKHWFDCIYQHHNIQRFGAYSKADALNFITADLYQEAEWKLI